MKFDCVLSLLFVGQVVAQNVFCTYAATNCNGNPYKCGKLGECVANSAAASIKRDGTAYFQYTSTDCGSSKTTNTIVYPDTDTDCKEVSVVTVSVQQHTAPENYCFYTTTACPDAGLVTCAKKDICMQYGVGMFVKAKDFKATAYTDNTCTTANTVASAVTNIILKDKCERPGTSATVYAKAVTELATPATTPAEYLCGYIDKECKNVLNCNKVTDGCKKVGTLKYFKRNTFTNKVELHATDKCDSWSAMSAEAPTVTDCKKVDDLHYAKYSKTEVSGAAINFLSLAVAAIVTFFSMH
eukprot:GHVR01030428.1.p1 GENE.GHVR01030428.1~~GHVR01030428.1.p1  ORF type:complete len:298 (+),score=29.41 GHVR01030428.1:48-941(+)